MNEKLAATRKEVEADFAAWEAAGATGTRSRSDSPGSQSNSDNVASDHNDAVDDKPKKSFAAIMEATHDKGAKKKSASDKRREYEMRVRAEDGVEGPCDFNVAGESWEL